MVEEIYVFTAVWAIEENKLVLCQFYIYSRVIQTYTIRLTSEHYKIKLPEVDTLIVQNEDIPDLSDNCDSFHGRSCEGAQIY